ncbi:MAG: leucine-rich repeat protein, partial [Lachnospiraceae bacterium]|nr:leucine-rich repeat protein [Lachnospiraceae bacterium]
IGYNNEQGSVAVSDNKATLLAAKNIEIGKFCNYGDTIYIDSVLREEINGIAVDTLSDCEIACISARTLQPEEYKEDAPYTDGVNGGEVTDYLWPLSTQEAFYTDSELRKASGSWWLRSPGSSWENVAYVEDNGKLQYEGLSVIDASNGHLKPFEKGVRPAFYLDLSSVLFTSAAVGGKDPGTAGHGTLNAVPAYADNAWKLTIHDTTRDSEFTASAKTGAVLSQGVGYTSWTVPVVYSGAKTGNNEYVSAILVDSEGTALYYGHIADANGSADSGDSGVNVMLPPNLPKGTYTLKVFNEQCNGDMKTDPSSAMHDIELSVTNAAAAPTFTPAAGTYDTEQNVTIACETDNAVIYYTTDGTTPSRESTKYTGPIPVSATTTIKAMAVKEGKDDSAVSTALYTIKTVSCISKYPLARTGLVFSDQERELITVGETAEGTFYYALTDSGQGRPEFDGESSQADKKWRTSVPKAKDVGTYYVWYMVKGDGNHNDFVENDPIEVKINKAGIAPTLSLAGWTCGSAANTPVLTGNTGNAKVTYTYAVKGSDEYSATVPTAAGDYTVKAEIAPTASYEGASVTANFTISKAETSGGTNADSKPNDTTTQDSPKEKGSTITATGSGATYKVISDQGQEPTVEYAGTDSKEKNVEILETVQDGKVTYKVNGISANAFKGNKTVESVKIPASVTKIGSKAFYGCKNLKTVSIGKNVTEIGDSAFANCSKLTKITMPAKGKKFGKNLFKGCKKLKTIIIKAKKLTEKSIAKGAFKGLGKGVTIKVPKGKRKAYEKLFRKKGLSKKVKVK